MNESSTNPLFGASVLKLSFQQKNMLDTPGFKFVYQGTLRELGVTDGQVDRYIRKHKPRLIEHINANAEKLSPP